MKRKIIICGIILLFVGLAISPNINADIDNQSIENRSDKDIFHDTRVNPVQLVFQLIHKLRNHKEIQTVDSETDLMQIIESDAELNRIFMELKGFDCGCTEENKVLDRIWPFPVICILLYPFLYLALYFDIMLAISLPVQIFAFIGEIFNCFWA